MHTQTNIYSHMDLTSEIPISELTRLLDTQECVNNLAVEIINETNIGYTFDLYVGDHPTHNRLYVDMFETKIGTNYIENIQIYTDEVNELDVESYRQQVLYLFKAIPGSNKKVRINSETHIEYTI